MFFSLIPMQNQCKTNLFSLIPMLNHCKTIAFSFIPMQNQCKASALSWEHMENTLKAQVLRGNLWIQKCHIIYSMTDAMCIMCMPRMPTSKRTTSDR